MVSNHGLEPGTRIVLSDSIRTLAKYIGGIVQECNVKETEPSECEQHDHWRDDTVGQENDSQVTVDRVHGTPLVSSNDIESGPQFTWSVVEKSSQNVKQDKTDNLEQSTTGNGESLQNHVGDVKVGGFRQVR
ncbi:hypothetical protein OGAPHI_001211 [Ogataea philodendri]|uniref:Uncharacterized protein n=1 Tax=Ogataea philodendri TaxID=1378263 RepID=A0A9P8T9B4_9ASCO|nr:uncharacterized protein OGAPHI_001211 [Ogataea philodendri]KAH3670696.1 hypothetical protein OGAPHI_001211 [Ogataea philodendri]